MTKLFLAGIFALSVSTSLAQTHTAPTAPAAPANAGAGSATAGEPANLCQELLAFMKAPPEPEAPISPAKPAATQSAPQTSAPSDQQAGTAKQDSKAASGEAVPPKAAGGTQSAQQQSGQSGPAHTSPEPNPATAKQGTAQGAPQSSGLSAPVPTEPTPIAKESQLSIAEAEKLAEANDIAACRDASRKLRLAGVAVPPPLLALTALDLQYQQNAKPPSQKPETGAPTTAQ
ncbi:hypothetical protein EET67_20780 [Pseudaminobacter arsenicus]|uniref:Uncharacterized protein n=1 Tax=Borborobacter arsenicus TaxID=1851146 RepID=A0A432V1A5_9HYPH|nr:hypothetical protein [Pseudaminobacter arsenicus]RUM95832.1 hypothetical protein EET67_20780 [Pseudaminobacter arsenicus]